MDDCEGNDNEDIILRVLQYEAPVLISDEIKTKTIKKAVPLVS